MQKQIIKNRTTKAEIFQLQLFSLNFNETIQENKILLIFSPEVFETVSAFFPSRVFSCLQAIVMSGARRAAPPMRELGKGPPRRQRTHCRD